MAAENIIITYGGGEALHYIFNGIAMVLSLDKGFANSLLHLTGVVGVLWSSTLMYMRSSIQVGMMWFGWFLLTTTLLFGPRSSLIIKDEILPIKTYKVDNVPLALAITSSTISNFSHAFTKKMESVFRLPDYLPYNQHGSIFASRLLAKAREFKIIDPTFNSNMERFIQQCVVYDAMIGAKYSLKDLKTTDDIWELVSAKPSKILGFLYKDQDANPKLNEIVTCAKGVQLLQAGWTKQVDVAAQKYGQLFFANKKSSIEPGSPEAILAKNTFLASLPQSYKLLTSISQNSTKLLQQEMMLGALRSAGHSKMAEYGQAYANAKANLQQRSAMEAAGVMAADFLPMLKTVFECILYASFIFVWILAPLPGGYVLVGMYFRELMWIQSWPILFAVLNLLCTIWAQHKTAGILDGNGLNQINSLAMSEVNENMQAITGWLSLSVPVLSRVVVTGTLSGLSNLSGYLASSIQGITSNTASELVSGNLSLGNVQYDTSSVHQQSGFKIDRNSMHQSGQFMRNSENGFIITNNADNTIYQGGEGKTSSTFSTSIASGSHVAQQLNENASKEQSLAKSDGHEYANSISSTQREAVDLLTRVNKGVSKGATYGIDKNSSEGKTIHDSLGLANSIQKKLGVTDQEAFSLALGVGAYGGVGFDKGFASAGIKVDANGNYTTSSGNHIDHSKLQDLAKSHNYSENADSVARAFKNLQFNDSQGAEKGLADSINSSYEQAKTYRESYNAHSQNAERFSTAASMVTSGTLDQRTNETESALDYIAHQPASSGKGIIGRANAAKILDAQPKDGNLFAQQQEYLNEYKDDRAKSLINYVKTHNFKSEQELTQGYNVLKNTQHNDYNEKVEKQNKLNKAYVNNEAKNNDLDIKNMPEKLRNEKQQNENLVNYNLMEAEIDLLNQKELLDEQSNNGQKDMDERYNRNVVDRSLENNVQSYRWIKKKLSNNKETVTNNSDD